MSDFDTQARIVHKSNQIRDEIKSLYEWEKDMKQKEAKRSTSSNKEAFDQSYPMRNQIQTSKQLTSTASTVSTTTEKLADKKKPTVPNAVEKANEFKTRGNNCVKEGQYQKAVHYYTEAIRLNKSDPVYYTNRALCYLKQNKFKECIEDCTIAIGMDDKAVKAYYRRMQAREHIQNHLEAALSDCKMVLRIDPKNVDAQRGLVRLEELITSSKIQSKQERDCESVSKEANWSQFDGNDGNDGCDRIEFVTKSPHLRSKQALTRIAIVDCEGNGANDSNQEEKNEAKVTLNIDQTSTKTKLIANEQQSPNPIDLVIPKNAAQFYKTWISISDDSQKFAVLKGIYNADIGKMFGAQFSLEVLREILAVLKLHFVKQNLPIANILYGIVKNSQMTVISAMMNAEDKLAFTKLVQYMRIRGEDATQIETIQKTFDYLISM